MSPSTEVDRLDRANERAYLEMARRCGGPTDVRDGLLLVGGPQPAAFVLNTVVRTDPRLPPPDVAERATIFFGRLGHRWTVETARHRDADLEDWLGEAGFRRALDLGGMVLDRPLPQAAQPDEVIIRPVVDDPDLASFRACELDGFAEDVPEHRAMVAATFPDLASVGGPDAAAFVATVDGHPAAASVVYLAEGAGVVGWVCTLPAFRRRGLGELVTRAAANAGFEMGAAVSVLQSSPMGEPLYARMGYRLLTRYDVWVPPRRS